MKAIDRQVSQLFLLFGIIATLFPISFAFIDPTYWRGNEPLLWTTIVYSLTILLLVYERSLSISREKLLYLAEELTPLVMKLRGWRFTRKSSEEKLPILNHMRQMVIHHRRFLFVLSLIPRSYANLLEETFQAMRLVQRELTWLHSAVRADPEGHRIMQDRDEVVVDEVIYEVVTGRTGVAKDDVIQVIAPVFDQHAERLVKIRRLFNRLLELIPQLSLEWEQYIRINYISQRALGALEQNGGK